MNYETLFLQKVHELSGKEYNSAMEAEKELNKSEEGRSVITDATRLALGEILPEGALYGVRKGNRGTRISIRPNL